MKLNRLVPMLPVENLDKSIEFYQKLGFHLEEKREDWGWAMLGLDQYQIMLDQSIYLHKGTPREAVLYLYPDDIGQYHQHVRSAGLDIPDLETTFYGLSEFRIADPDGNRLWIGQSILAEAQ